jgi:HisJ family histidinol phosphate phosphatase
MTEHNLLRDDHCHTIYSGHSAADSLVSDMVRSAHERGLSQIVVLEHLPVLPRGITLKQWRKGKNDREHLDFIAEEIEPLRAQFPDLEILRGVELDADPWALDGSLMLDDLSGLDLVVVATHILPGGDAFWFESVQFPEPEVRRELTDLWFDWAEAIVRRGVVDTFAHPGCMVAARGLVASFEGEHVLNRFAQLAALMAEHDVAFELNEGLFQKLPDPCRETYPLVVRAAREAGAQFTIGTDSHSMRSVGHYAWVHELLDLAQIPPSQLKPIPRRTQ